MLNSLLIKNYRLFKELQIDSLKRVNLIIGKNNVGKSSLLEALNLYLNRDNFIYQLFSNLNTRGEWDTNSYSQQELLNGLACVFYGRNQDYYDLPSGYIGIGKNEEVSFSLQPIIDPENGEDFCLVINNDNQRSEKLLSKFNNFNSPLRILKQKHNQNCYYVSPLSLYENASSLSSLWSKTVLTDKESYIIEALKIIEETVSRIAFVGEKSHDQKVLIKLGNLDQPVPIGSMGEGISHILNIILRLVHCENGTLLIDEFETGLHWSIQVELWKIIFHLSHQLNIQIFATTHSRDTLWTLQQVAVSEGIEEETRIIKLKALPKKQTIKAVELEVDQVKDLLEQGLEIR